VHRLTRLADALDWFIDRFGRLASWTAFALVAVMAFNVLLRYFFRTGSVAMQELEWHLMAPLALLGMSYCCTTGTCRSTSSTAGCHPARSGWCTSCPAS
jgi:TRAP-type mannitol/chloroaromatic compound transport system permease small subunit